MKKMLGAVAVLFVLVPFVYADDFTLSAPAGWEKKDSAALAQYQNGTGTFILTADRMPSTAATPDAYMDFIKEKLRGSFKEISFEPTTKGTKDAYETRELKYSIVMHGMTLRFHTLYVFAKGKAYTLTTSNLSSAIDAKFQADIAKFFTSFKIK